jgi:hypothetical protein
MLDSYLWIWGESYKPIGLARKLGLKRKDYTLPTDLVQCGRRKGSPHGTASLCIPLSRREELDRHIAQLESRLDSLSDLLILERSKFGVPPEMRVSIGATVGSDKHFTRSIYLEPRILDRLAALGIALEVCAYPCSED